MVPLNFYCRYISILPSIKLSLLVHPEEAIRLRQTSELEKPSNLHWFSNSLSERTEYSGEFHCRSVTFNINC